MRNLFAANMTDEENPILPVQVFLRAEVSADQTQRLDDTVEQGEALEKKAGLPWFGKLFLWVGTIAGLFGARLFLEEVFEEGFTELAVGGLIVAVVGFAVMGGLLLLARRRATAVLESDEGELFLQGVEQNAASSKAVLGIPEDAKDLDVLGSMYTIKRGKEKCPHKFMFEYVALDNYVFVENGELMLADLHSKYAIPLSAITAVRCQRKKTAINSWNKADAPKSATYKPYKIAYDEDNDIFTVRAVYTLEIAYNGERYALVVPDYDWELVLQPLTGLQVTLTEE